MDSPHDIGPRLVLIEPNIVGGISGRCAFGDCVGAIHGLFVRLAFAPCWGRER